MHKLYELSLYSLRLHSPAVTSPCKNFTAPVPVTVIRLRSDSISWDLPHLAWFGAGKGGAVEDTDDTGSMDWRASRVDWRPGGGAVVVLKDRTKRGGVLTRERSMDGGALALAVSLEAAYGGTIYSALFLPDSAFTRPPQRVPRQVTTTSLHCNAFTRYNS